MQKTDISVQELVSQIKRGELRLPEMQRGYVWRATRVRDLLDSLYRGFPSGNILVWETDAAMPQRDMAVSQQTSPFQSYKLLLDGQQRLTSLSAILRGDLLKVRGRLKPIEILFNLDHPASLEEVLEVEDDEDNDPDGIDDEDEEVDSSVEARAQKLTFVVSSPRLASLPNWVSVSEVLRSDGDAEFLRKAGVKGLDDTRYQKYSQRLQKLRQIRKYTYSVQVLERDLSYDEVTEVFVRVNSLGAKLRSSDLALAQITATWRGALKIFEEFEEECKEQGYPLSVGSLVRALVVFATGQSRFNTVQNLSVEMLNSAWSQMTRGLRFAIQYARNNAGIDNPALLTSPYLLISLAYLSHVKDLELRGSDDALLRFWTKIANGRGRYSRGSSETYLDQDLAVARRGDITTLIENVRQQFGRLHFDVEEFEGRNQRASVFRLAFQALRSQGARDWRSQLHISTSNFGADHKLQFHHVFPKAILQKHGYSTRDINDIANLTFLDGKTNRKISSTPPAEYLPEIVDRQGDEVLRRQCVPLDPSLWRAESYPDFLRERRKLLCEAVNAFLGDVPAPAG
jgi:hypothetical protein